MERIQVALEKARARRAAQAGPAGGANGPKIAHSDAAAVKPPPAPPEPTRSAQPVSVAPAISPADVVANWQVLTEVCLPPNLMMRNRIVAFAGGREAGTIDMMRTRILQEMRKKGWRRLAVTSPNPGCGKTTTCLNLAFSLARQPDLRTILLDLDMRRPGLARLLGLREARHFADVIAGKAAPGEHMHRYGMNLAFGTNARPARNPAELLQGAEIGPVLARIEADYAPAMLIFDMPPMLANDDMMAFASHVDCVLILAGAEETMMEELDNSERELSGVTNVLGVVLNKCRYRDPSYGYDYY